MACAYIAIKWTCRGGCEAGGRGHGNFREGGWRGYAQGNHHSAVCCPLAGTFTALEYLTPLIHLAVGLANRISTGSTIQEYSEVY